MNMTEVTLLNRTVAGFTRSSPSDIEAAAWYLLLGQYKYEDAEQAVINHFSGPDKHKFFEVGYILDGIKAINRLLPNQIEEDVRSAKARGMVSQDWPAHDALPADVAGRLQAARAAVRAADEYTPAITSSGTDIGRIGRSVPRGDV
jgi:hypothetical protein